MRSITAFAATACRLQGTALAIALAMTVPRLAPGQAAPAAGADTAVCLGFSFGPWTPKLDWQAAGHRGAADSARVARAPGGRGWASPDLASLSDTTLVLFPPWWPVGVVVDLSTRTPAYGDTVAGRAQAMVSDGRLRNPTSRVRAWRVPCTRP